MATLLKAPLALLPIPSRPSFSTRRRSRLSITSCISPSPAADFPHLAPANRSLVLDLVSTIENSLGDQLLPSAVPADVLFFQNESGNCKGSTDVRHGVAGSKVDLVLKSWMHCELPFGVLDITSIIAFLRPETDAPHLMLDFLQSSPNSLVLFADLLPRRDLVLDTGYLRHFYELSGLEKARKALYASNEVSTFFSSSLYVRSLLSPAAMAVNVGSLAEGRSLEELVAGPIAAAVTELVRVWLDQCALGVREVAEGDRAGLMARDVVIKKTAVDNDLAANLPPLFGPEVADRILTQIQKDFGI